MYSFLTRTNLIWAVLLLLVHVCGGGGGGVISTPSRGDDLRPRTDAKGTLAGMGLLAVCALRYAASCRYGLGMRLGTSLV